MLIASFNLGSAKASEAQAKLTANEPSIDISEIDTVFSEFAHSNSPGCAVGIAYRGELLFAKGYGMANLDWNQPITPETNFRIASVSKQITAAVIAHAAIAGHLSLDDTLQKWVPEIPEYERPITVRHLIHHTNGLRDYYALVELTGRSRNDVYSEQFVLDLVSRQKGSNFPAGERMSYNNTGYFLLGLIVERATGQSLRDYARRHVFDPLGMTRTAYLDDRGKVVEQRAVGYVRKGSEAAMYHMWNFEQVGSAGVFTNLRDFARWDRNFYSEEVGGEGFTDLLTTTGAVSDGASSNYAFGLMHGAYRGQKVIFHDGSMGASRAHFDRYPDLQTSIMVFCNTITDAWGLSRQVADIVLQDQLEPDTASVDEGTTSSGDATANRLETIDLADDQLNALVGYWQIPSFDFIFEIGAEDGQLYAIIGDRLEVQVLSEDTIYIEASDARIAFGNLADGRYTTATGVAEGMKFDAMRPSKVSMPSQYAGRYYSEELDTTFTLRVEKEELRIRDSGEFEGPAVPLRDKQGFQTSLGKISFVRKDEQITGFTLDLDRARGLWFEKQ